MGLVPLRGRHSKTVVAKIKSSKSFGAGTTAGATVKRTWQRAENGSGVAHCTKEGGGLWVYIVSAAAAASKGAQELLPIPPTVIRP